MSDMDITEFLAACVKDDEDYALNACQFVGAEWYEPFSGAVQFGGQDTNPECEMALTHDSGISRHMERHDPARVLREVAAKRAIIAETLNYMSRIDGEWGCCHNEESIAAGRCEDLLPENEPIFRALASVYADRPGYKEEWKPTEPAPTPGPAEYWATLRKHEQEAREARYAAGEKRPENMWKAPEEGEKP